MPYFPTATGLDYKSDVQSEAPFPCGNILFK